MKEKSLARYFSGVAIKRLSEVEANPGRSNQHEFNGVRKLHEILGQEKRRFPARFLYMTDQDDGMPVTDSGFLSWYDSRENDPHRSEYRLYYSDNRAMHCAAAGDLLVIARRPDESLLTIVAEKGTTIEAQILYLFGLDTENAGFQICGEEEMERNRADFTARFILEHLGIETGEDVTDFLEAMLEKYGGQFPAGNEFSAYARYTLPHVTSHDDPDAALMAWMEREEMLYRTLEKHLLGQSLHSLVIKGEEDTEPFVKLVQSTLQRRRSRAGQAMENHLEKIFKDHRIAYTRGGITEGRSRPDFLFPGIDCYHNSSFPPNDLFMLGVKTTCKDRWRQVLAEASRIPRKHLATLEPAISKHQTDEMKKSGLCLVIPRKLHGSFGHDQQDMLLGIRDFTGMLMLRQCKQGA